MSRAGKPLEEWEVEKTVVTHMNRWIRRGMCETCASIATAAELEADRAEVHRYWTLSEDTREHKVQAVRTQVGKDQIR